MKAFESQRRLPEANWFALAGALGNEDETLFLIGDGANSYTAPRDADLYLFANDMYSRYAINHGALKVTVTRTG